MPRAKRICPPGHVFHVLNRAVARLTIFEKPEDYDAFLRVVEEVSAEVPLPILAVAVMPNHWHFVVRPSEDGQVSRFFRLLSVTHTMRWHAHYRTSGTGHLYQGRFKSFPVQDDEHLLTVLRYVERNALRAGLVDRAEDWAWGSACLRGKGERSWLAAPPNLPLPPQWIEWVNQPQNEKEVDVLRNCIRRGAPFGSPAWCRSSVLQLGLESTLRPRGRPKNES